MSSNDNTQNPFGDPNELNPFGDPYVTLTPKEAPQHVPIVSSQQQPPPPIMANPPEYTSVPLSTNQQQPGSAFQPIPFSNNQPATMQGMNSTFPSQAMAPPAYSPSAQQLQLELEKKAAELENKEQELNRLQNAGVKINNFPPTPSFCPWKPCYYHDISIEIPTHSQKNCKLMYYLWQFYVLTLLINFISAFALLVSEGGDTAATTFGVALLYMLLFSPCSFVFWYRPVYKSLRDDSSFNYMLFFFVFFFQIALDILYAIGIPRFGTCGWINGISQAANGNGAIAALMLITATMWTVLCVGNILALKRVHSSYRNSGASVEKAQGEFASGLAQNKAVQNVAIESVRAGMSGDGTRK